MKYLIFSLILLIPFSVAAQASTTKASTDSVIRVGVKQTPPFIMKDANDGYTGASIKLWENIAQNMPYTYKYVEYDLKGLIEALNNKEIDASINPLTVTSERVEQIDFSQPFFITNLAIGVNTSGQGKWLGFIRNFFSVQFFEAIVLLLVVLLIFGLLVWFFEKDKNDEEFGKGIKGVADGLWWSAVTMTTVGYGDKSPKTTGGRIVALIWMFTAIIIISGFTASIASSLTVSQLESSIESVNDLKKARVAAVSASTGASFLDSNNIKYKEVKTIDEALKSLSNGNVDAVVYDEPLMRYGINKLELENSIVILPNKFSTQYYSLSFPKDSELLQEVNPALLKEIKGIEWKAILQEYSLEK